MVRLMSSGMPAATPDALPKLERMFLRTTPLWFSTSGPFEPSAGYGPAVSSGMVVQSAAAAEPDAPDMLAVPELAALPVGRHAASASRLALVVATPRSLRS